MLPSIFGTHRWPIAFPLHATTNKTSLPRCPTPGSHMQLCMQFRPNPPPTVSNNDAVYEKHPQPRRRQAQRQRKLPYSRCKNAAAIPCQE